MNFKLLFTILAFGILLSQPSLAARSDSSSDNNAANQAEIGSYHLVGNLCLQVVPAGDDKIVAKRDQAKIHCPCTFCGKMKAAYDALDAFDKIKLSKDVQNNEQLLSSLGLTKKEVLGAGIIAGRISKEKIQLMRKSASGHGSLSDADNRFLSDAMAESSGWQRKIYGTIGGVGTGCLLGLAWLLC